MASIDSGVVVRSEVIQAGFGFYTDAQLEQLSCCKVTSPVSFDSLGHALNGGLLDGRMGATDSKEMCKTCNCNYMSCLGHPGHVKLDVSVYHPFLFAPMFTLLKTKCVNCHKFRINSNKTRQLLIKLKLLEMGDLEGAARVDDLCAASAENNAKEGASNKKETVASKKDKDKGKDKAKENDKDKAVVDVSLPSDIDVEADLKMYEHRYKLYVSKPNRQPAAANCKAAQAKLIDDFYRQIMKSKKCENCSGFSPTFRRDGYSKIFQKALPKKYKDIMSNMNMKIRSALEETQEFDEDEDEDDGYSDDDDDDEDGGNAGGRRRKKEASSDKFLVPSEVEQQVNFLWKQQVDFLDFVWSRAINNGIPHSVPDKEGYKLFFIRVILVPPNRFRPTAVVGESSSEHPQNIHLAKILNANEKIRMLYNVDPSKKSGSGSAMDETKGSENDTSSDDDSVDVAVAVTTTRAKASALSRLSTEWIELQNSVNCYMDSAKDPNVLANQSGAAGIRQLLERKEGLFRMNMMGKRVNYCCRSVISPDPFLGTNEIGIPLQFAKTLHYPVPVNDWNVKYLRTLVERGPHEYPGANIIETPTGAQIKLEKLSASERSAKAKLLLSSPGYKVFRHLIDGDLLLVNRQPTLHKAGIMSHKARVYKAVKEQTLRMHYANCNSYNADFDGDEMNCHFVQNEIARAEATLISNTDNQYIVATSGNPLRGLIQDHVTAAVKMTSKNAFFNKQDFQQLIYIAVSGLSGTEIVTAADNIEMPRPTIMKPKELWTGKQVITCLMTHLCNMTSPRLQPLNLDGGSKTPAAVYGTDENEHIVVFRHGELLQGTLDKAAIGNVSLGIVHAVYELYGSEYARHLLNAFGRLFTFYLQDAGHTCSIEDLILVDSAEVKRKHLLEVVTRESALGIREFLSGLDQNSGSAAFSKENSKELSAKDIVKLQEGVADLLTSDKAGKAKLDGAAQGYVNKSASEVIKACLQTGLKSPFLRNNFAIMVLTGAKGSTVNQSLITCFLGQQALEGQRVPIMASGKTLPSFPAYDITPRANGFVRDRFLTGIRPQEFYFHCMAGREGLVDTAVKTSRSGYLQRCLVKHLEELKVAYDNTVRDSGQNVIQFLYGEDGLDACSSALFGAKANQMLFMARNNQVLIQKHGLRDVDFLAKTGLETESATSFNKLVSSAKEMVNSKITIEKVTKNCTILARRKINPEGSWKVSNVTTSWEPATVIKVRGDNRDSLDASLAIGGADASSGSDMTIDIRYLDNHIEKKVPLKIFSKVKSKVPGLDIPMSDNGKIPCEIVKVGLPSTTMNSLYINKSLGACSEKMQDFLDEYAKKNPDGVIDAHLSSNTKVTKEGLEYLMWVKYMRALAAPGEAVGCVAAQSIGEPSTQMTLNTFHLAGHGAGNVTLGIPRLREIIMTASTKPKTPTMMIPLNVNEDMTAARALARKLSRLSLSQILSHKGGIEVVEVETLTNRVYKIKLIFEKLSDIERTFSINFESLCQIVKEAFIPKLMYWIRRSGEKSVAAPSMDLNELKSKVSATDEVGGRGGGRGSSGADGVGAGDDHEGVDKDGFEGDAGKGGKNRRDKNVVDALMEGSDDEEEDDDDGSGDDGDGNTPKKGAKGEISGYDELDDIFGSHGADDNVEVIDRETSGFDSDMGNSDSDENEGNNAKSASKATGKAKAKVPTKRAPKSSKAVDDDNLKFNDKDGTVEMSLTLPTHNRRLLMVQLAEKAATLTAIRQTKNIAMAYPVQDPKNDNRPSVATEGVNFEEIWDLPESLIDHNKISSNDIFSMLQVYGVEAARKSIVNEMSNVFGAYGIDVNARHLSLIADFMTRKGGYIPMNRIGMTECPSTLLQMSFETTCTFLMKAAMEGRCDDLESPSSRIVLGNVIKVGTGGFDVTTPIL